MSLPTLQGERATRITKVLNNENIQAFLLAVERKSIAESARRLGLSKSMVSKRINDLERTLGTQLLLHSTNSVVPTDAGLAFYKATAALMRQLTDVAEEIAGRTHRLCGPFRITAPVSLTRHWLAPVITRFAASYPHLCVTVETEDRIVDIETEGYDLAIRSGRVTDGTLIAQRIASCARVVVCSPSYRAQHGDVSSLEQLPTHPCLNYSGVPASATWSFLGPDHQDKPRSLSPVSTFFANNGDTLREAAVQGLGIAVLPIYVAAHDLREGRLVRLLEHETPQEEVIYAVHPRNQFSHSKLRAFIEYARVAMLDHPWRE